MARRGGADDTPARSVVAPVVRIAILDGSGTIVQVSESWRDLARATGVPTQLDAFVGTNYLDECTRASQRGCREAEEARSGIESVLADRSTSYRHLYQPSEAATSWIEIMVERLDDGRVIVAHLDVTDRRSREVEIEAYHGHIGHLSRVAFIGQLAGTIAHELRQPLAAIRANAEAGALLLTERPEADQELREVFQAILLDDLRAARIIDRIRRLLRGESTSEVPVQLNDVCRAVHVLDHQAAMQRASLRLILDPLLPPTRGDPEALQQVVINLALNAIESVSRVPAPREVLVSTRRQASDVVITVSDTGVGLSPEVHQHLFEPFHSDKPLGTGLGLSIVRSTVEQHGGRVSATNRPSGGAEFRIVLPIREESSKAP